jgi:tetratricopeptide (TPR) repeat protein
MRIALTLLICIYAVSIPAIAEQRPDTIVREDFFAAASANDPVRLDAAMKKVEEFLAKDPTNARMIVWQGVGQFFGASFAFQKKDYQAGQELQRQGLARMQQAVDLAPTDAAVLVARGAALISSSRYMPPQAGRTLAEIGVRDYEKTLEVQRPTFDKLSTHSMGELLLGLADGSIRMGNLDKARSYFEMMASQSTLQGSVYENKARAWLSDSPESKTREFFQCSGCHKSAAE